MLRLRPRIPVDEGAAFSDWELSPQLVQLLRARGVGNSREARAFLCPDVSGLHDPYLMRDMQAAVNIIRRVIGENGRIVVYGDYDVDGCCATALMMETLRRLGAKAEFYIPSRHEEGYGLNCNAVESLAKRCALLISVDCGIVSFKEAELAKKLGLEMIITDHHEPAQSIPCAGAVLNPLLGEYPFRRLCGAGVAFKLSQALLKKDALDLMDLAALATVADMVPLLGENRIITALGLRQMNESPRLGLQALLEKSGLMGKKITAGHLGFQVGPRMNAGGRLGDAARSVRLLLSEKEEEAQEIAEELDTENARRQHLESQVVEEAARWALEEADFAHDKILIVCQEGWNSGVVGLAASRLVERFGWPAVVLSQEGDVCVGSARSIPGVNIHRALCQCEDLFLRFGGHAQAAGMTLLAEKLPELRRRLNQAVAEIAEKDAYIPSAVYDLPLHLEEVTLDLVREMEALSPTGFGNPSPVFWIQDAQILQSRTVGRDGKHVKLRLGQGNAALDGIGFGLAQSAAGLPEEVDVLGALGENEWMGRTTAQMEVSRMFPHQAAEAFRQQCRQDRFDQAVLQGVWPKGKGEEEHVLRARVRQALEENIQGTLLLVYTRQGALEWSEFLEKEGLDARTDFCFEQPQTPQRFNALCAAPRTGAEKGYDRVIELDAGGAGEALSQWLPSDDQLRNLYRLLKRQGDLGSMEALAEALDLRKAAIQLGLDVFQELKLAVWQALPFQAALLPAQKCNLSDSRTLMRLRMLVRREE